MKVTLLGGTRQEDLNPFKEQVAEFFEAVVRKDGPPFFKHLDRRFFGVSIIPWRVIDDFDEYLEFHRWWMQNTTGRWSYEVERYILYRPDVATVVIVAQYEDIVDNARTRRTIRIKNGFLKQGDTWYLAENQNSVLDS